MKKFKAIISVLLISMLVMGTMCVAFADGEDYDTIDTALAFTTSAQGSLATASDVDYFKATVANAGKAKVRLVSTSATTEYKVDVIGNDKDESKLVASFNVNKAGEVSSEEFSTAVGSYYIKVSAVNAAQEYVAETYMVFFDIITKENYEIEPNDTAAAATKVKAEAIKDAMKDSLEIGGTIAAGDVDFFAFSVVVPEGYLQVKFYNTAASDFKVSVIQKTTDKVIGSFKITSDTADKTSADMGIPSGDYYLKVEGVDGGAGAYMFKLRSKLDLQRESEYNDVLAKANVITIGTEKYAALSSPEDIDAFKVTSDQDQKIIISCANDTRNDSSVTWEVTLYNADMTASYQTTICSKAQNAEFDLSTREAGTYIIVVKAGTNYSEGAYNIKSQQVEKPQPKTSWWDKIKSLDWKSFWVDNFKPLMANIDFLNTIVSLIKLSIGSIIKAFG